MADSAFAPTAAAALRARTLAPRHTALVRVTHWLTTACFIALLVSGLEIVVSHPRFYWGEAGNIHTRPLFKIPIPASRSTVPTGYGYVLPDQNGWSRALHFQTAWVLVVTGLLYVGTGLLTAHFRRNLVPGKDDFSGRALSKVISNHLRLKPPDAAEAWSYNGLQRLTYLVVIFVLFPLIIWTGLAMSPAVVSAIPAVVTTFGGQQSARTIHFFLTFLLLLFLFIHVAMIWIAGFRNRTRAMVTGRGAAPTEQV